MYMLIFPFQQIERWMSAPPPPSILSPTIIFVREESQAAWEDPVGIDHFYGRHNTRNCGALTETSASILSASRQQSGFYRIPINLRQYSQVILTQERWPRLDFTFKQNDPNLMINVAQADTVL